MTDITQAAETLREDPRTYGAAPAEISVVRLPFTEYMHYMYLPIRLPGMSAGDFAIPERLWFARDVVLAAAHHEWALGNTWDYVYLTARRGFATPGNPLNRPGWHADGFGTDDVNYVWTDRYPTLFAVQEFERISGDHLVSIAEFEDQIDPARIITYADRALLRLDPFVIHAAPKIPAPGGERSFLKVSFSNDRYNLVGNSHNYLLDYDWPMHARETTRNDPAKAGADHG